MRRGSTKLDVDRRAPLGQLARRAASAALLRMGRGFSCFESGVIAGKEWRLAVEGTGLGDGTADVHGRLCTLHCCAIESSCHCVVERHAHFPALALSVPRRGKPAFFDRGI